MDSCALSRISCLSFLVFCCSWYPVPSQLQLFDLRFPSTPYTIFDNPCPFSSPPSRFAVPDPNDCNFFFSVLSDRQLRAYDVEQTTALATQPLANYDPHLDELAVEYDTLLFPIPVTNPVCSVRGPILMICNRHVRFLDPWSSRLMGSRHSALHHHPCEMR